ncbi:helix-turn-helix domain-containing protein [Clostridium algoriphilum]|uniref:helix-turn-helix domain-containing protein n=1 Tax=Clostridium algoriphilum TaxID=198347 RepID=UPI001CF38255|nr:helix-turn-helix transcriptional regulator [Clostridium algoriphilum]MCB2292419.1 helix-turn-helix domain-containing protein [Clostridium algoriphilum]
MIGLEFILNLYGMQQQELAVKLKIKKQNINLWFKGRQDVSKKHLHTLSEMFNIPQEYFQKELGEIDKLEIQKMKLETSVESDIGVGYAIERYDYEIKERKLFVQIGNTLTTCFNDEKSDGGLYDASELLDLYKMFTDIVADKEINKSILEGLLLATVNKYQGNSTEKDKFVLKVADEIKEYNKKLLDEKILMDMDDGSDE